MCIAFNDNVFSDGLYFNAVEVDITDGILTVTERTSITDRNTPGFIVRYLETGKFASGTGFLMNRVFDILQDKYKAHEKVVIEKDNILLVNIASSMHLDHRNSSVETIADEDRQKTKRRNRLMSEFEKLDDKSASVKGCFMVAAKDIKILSSMKWPETGFASTFKQAIQEQMIGPTPSVHKLKANRIPIVVSDIPIRERTSEVLSSCLDSWKVFSKPGDVITLQDQFQVVSSINLHISSAAYSLTLRAHIRARKDTPDVHPETSRLRPITGDPRSAMFQLMQKCGALCNPTVDGLDVAVGNEWQSKSYLLSKDVLQWGGNFSQLVSQVVGSCNGTDTTPDRFVYPTKLSSKVSAIKRELNLITPSVQRMPAPKRKSPGDSPSLQERLNTAAKTMPISSAGNIVDVSGTSFQ